MKILITGISGFIGKNLVEAFKNKYKIVGFSRRKVNNIEHHQGDIRNIKALNESSKGVDVIIHLAGVIRGSKNEFYEANCIGTRNVGQVAAENGVKKIIYISSLAASGPLEKKEPISYYGYTKRLGELELLKNSHFYKLIILRPPIIYGPYEQEIYKIIKITNKLGMFPVLSDMKLSFIYVKDLIAVIDKVLQIEYFHNKVYTVCEDGFYSLSEVADIIAYQLNKKIKKIPINSILPLMNIALKLSGIFWDKLSEINAKAWVCSPKKFNNDFNYCINTDLFTGMFETIRWYRENGWL